MNELMVGWMNEHILELHYSYPFKITLNRVSSSFSSLQDIDISPTVSTEQLLSSLNLWKFDDNITFITFLLTSVS